MATKITRLYHFFLHSFGIHIKLIDFNCNKTNRNASFRCKDHVFKLISVILFLILITIQPICFTSLRSYSPVFGNKKKLEYLVASGYFYTKYFAFIIIFILEFVNAKWAITHLVAIKTDFVQLESIYSHWFAHKKGEKSKMKNWRTSLTDLTNLKTKEGLALILIMMANTAFNALRTMHRSKPIKIARGFEMALIYMPNIFITSFAWHLSVICVQIKNVYHSLDELNDAIACEICNQMKMRTKKQKRFKYFAVATKNEIELNTMTNHLASVLQCHQKVTANVLKVLALYSLQLNIVILKDFSNIIFEVWKCTCQK